MDTWSASAHTITWLKDPGPESKKIEKNRESMEEKMEQGEVESGEKEGKKMEGK
jgi:hypothetical protein